MPGLPSARLLIEPLRGRSRRRQGSSRRTPGPASGSPRALPAGRINRTTVLPAAPCRCPVPRHACSRSRSPVAIPPRICRGDSPRSGRVRRPGRSRPRSGPGCGTAPSTLRPGSRPVARPNSSGVAEAHVLQFPDDLKVDVGACVEILQPVVEAAAEVAEPERGGRIRRAAAQEQAGDERPHLLLANPGERRLHQSLLAGELRAIRQADRDQRVDVCVERHQRHLQIGRLNRLEHGRRIEPEHADEVGAGDPPALPGGIERLVPAREIGASPDHVNLREDAVASRGQAAPCKARHVGSAAGGVLRAGEFAARLLHVEVRFRDGEHAVVPRRLQTCLTGPHDLPFDEGCVDRVAERRRTMLDPSAEHAATACWCRPRCRRHPAPDRRGGSSRRRDRASAPTGPSARLERRQRRRSMRLCGELNVERLNGLPSRSALGSVIGSGRSPDVGMDGAGTPIASDADNGSRPSLTARPLPAANASCPAISELPPRRHRDGPPGVRAAAHLPRSCCRLRKLWGLVT